MSPWKKALLNIMPDKGGKIEMGYILLRKGEKSKGKPLGGAENLKG